MKMQINTWLAQNYENQVVNVDTALASEIW